MNTDKLKQIYSSWNKASSIDTYTGAVLATSAISFPDSQNSTIEYSIFFVQDNCISKSWQYQFGNTISPFKHNYSIFHWKPLKDINFNGINWKDYKTLPTYNSHIIGWLNESDLIRVDNNSTNYNNVPLTLPSCRLHFGYFMKKGLFKFNYLVYPGYHKIPWEKVFRWCYVDELFEDNLNEDARSLPINPTDYVSDKFISK